MEADTPKVRNLLPTDGKTGVPLQTVSIASNLAVGPTKLPVV
jgi:hypothetical protein